VKIGFIGLGMMGRGMAANIQKAGYQMVVHDLAKPAAEPYLAKGAGWADTPRALAEVSDLVFTSLPTPADVEAVAFGDNGLASGFLQRKGAAWFDLSTNAVDVVRRLNAKLAERQVDFLDAPVSGGPAGAASGKLAIWVGGDKAVFDRHEPVLKAMADQARYIGPIGAGSIAKLTHNCASAALSVLLAEVFTMGVKAGVEPLALFEAIRQGATGRMRTFDVIGNRFLPGDFDKASFALRLVHKDVTLGMQLGREFNVPMRLVGLVHEELTEAMNRGWAARDSKAVMQLQVERAGLDPIKVPEEQIKAVMEEASRAAGDSDD
jgi:3-hydroxyisobutyrate dehydrogenase-like beta-hydroxyacid dehydrogenase